MRLARIRSRVSASGACLRTTSSKVCLASSIIAQSSPPLVWTPTSVNSAGSTCRSVLPSSGRPSESASRFAGSIVSTATFFPRAAIPAAIAAEIVVLPTPPEPAQMHTSLPRRSSETPATSRHLCGEPPDVLRPELGLEDERERPDGRVDQLAKALELFAVRERTAAFAQGGPDPSPGSAVHRIGDGGEPLRVRRREAL